MAWLNLEWVEGSDLELDPGWGWEVFGGLEAGEDQDVVFRRRISLWVVSVFLEKVEFYFKRFPSNKNFNRCLL